MTALINNIFRTRKALASCQSFVINTLGRAREDESCRTNFRSRKGSTLPQIEWFARPLLTCRRRHQAGHANLRLKTFLYSSIPLLFYIFLTNYLHKHFSDSELGFIRFLFSKIFFLTLRSGRRFRKLNSTILLITYHLLLKSQFLER